MSFRAAAVRSLLYVAGALVFGAVLGLAAGWSLGAQFLAGYVVEKSLSVDNLFVFVIIMSTFAVPAEHHSIPAVYGVTRHPYIVLAANVFALLGLRALFFLVSGLLDRLVYLSTGLSVILTFIGVKLVLHFAHLQHHPVPEISTAASLAVIVVVLAVTTLASLARVRRRPRLRAHAGSLRAPRSDAQSTDTR